MLNLSALSLNPAQSFRNIFLFLQTSLSKVILRGLWDVLIWSDQPNNDFCFMPTDSTIAFKMYCSFSNLTECGMSRCSSGGGGWQWVTHAAGGPTSDHTTLPSPGNGMFSPFCSFCYCINAVTIEYLFSDYYLTT